MYNNNFLLLLETERLKILEELECTESAPRVREEITNQQMVSKAIIDYLEKNIKR